MTNELKEKIIKEWQTKVKIYGFTEHDDGIAKILKKDILDWWLSTLDEALEAERESVLRELFHKFMLDRDGKKIGQQEFLDFFLSHHNTTLKEIEEEVEKRSLGEIFCTTEIFTHQEK